MKKTMTFEECARAFCEACLWNLEHYVPRANAIRERLPGLATAMLRAYQREPMLACGMFAGREG